MKYSKLLTLVFFISLSFSSFGQENHSLLWKISGNGLSEPSYLYGTIHVQCPESIKLSPQTMDALAKSERLVLELDMDDPSFMTTMQQQSVNPEMKNISAELGEEDLATLNQFFKDHYQMDLSQLGIMKPFVLLSMMFAKALDCPAPGSYEGAFMAQAKEKQWEVLGLEEVEDQFAIFNDVPVTEQLGWLVGYAKDLDTFKASLAQMIQLYEAQDVEGLVKVMSDSPEYRDLGEELLFNRNEKWIDKMVAFAKEKPSFFAVGAAHLGSDRGVIELLQQKGYSVKPILQQ